MLQQSWTSRKIAIVVLMSSLGGISSFAIGWAGTILALTPFGPVAGQTLSGLHIIWLIIAAILVQRRGAATATGALKGIIEMTLPNHLGVFVFFMSLLQGALVDLVILPFRRTTTLPVLLASGVASASNLLVLQIFQFLPSGFPLIFYLTMYGASFVSGLILGGYPTIKVMNAAKLLNSDPGSSSAH